LAYWPCGEFLEREQLTANLRLASVLLDMRAQLLLDVIEGLQACGVCGAGCLSLADEIEDDIFLRVPITEAWGPQGEGHHPVADQPDAVATVDLARCEARSLLCKPSAHRHHPEEDDDDYAYELHPRREPKASG